MTFEQYQRLALRTCKVIEANIYNSIHMILGITSEYFETVEATRKMNQAQSIQQQIDETLNTKKELGDVLWYTSLLAHFNQLDFSRGHDFNKIRIEKSIENLNSIFKANWIYDRSMLAPDKTGVPPIDQVQEAIYNIIYWVETEYFFKIEEVMRLNIDKLAARYPEKFEADLANNRKQEDN